jgi:hypothetical protein
LPIVRAEFSILPGAVRDYEIEKSPFLRRRLCLEQQVCPLGQLEKLDTLLDVAPVGGLMRLDGAFLAIAATDDESVNARVAANGLCPSLSGILRNEMKDRYGPEYAEVVRLIGGLRNHMMALGWDGRRIRETVSNVCRAGIAQVISTGDRKRVEEFLSEFPLPLTGSRG